MIERVFKKMLGASRLIKEIFPAIRKASGSALRWESLKRDGTVVIGRHTYGLPNVYSWNKSTKLMIGNFCSIAEDVVFILGGEHRMDWITTYPFNSFGDTWPDSKSVKGHPATKGDISVGHDVWIGHGALILSGITIGNGAVIGAGSVVTRNVDDYAVVVGNPAKFVKFRFDEAQRKELLNIAWWDWPDEEISKNLQILMSSPQSRNTQQTDVE